MAQRRGEGKRRLRGGSERAKSGGKKRGLSAPGATETAINCNFVQRRRKREGGEFSGHEGKRESTEEGDEETKCDEERPQRKRGDGGGGGRGQGNAAEGGRRRVQRARRI